jgi:CCR4-NOT transcription complex subunit 1
MTVYRKASKDAFPLEYLFENWKNTPGQLSFLKHAVAAPPDMFNIGATLRRIDADGLPTVGKGALHQTWYSLALIETLLKLAEVENYGVVRQIFNYPIKHCPELLCIGLAQATKVQ